MTGLLDSCGAHCGTAEGLTRHCRCCHAFSWFEADGCGQGWDGSSWAEFAETHEPGSHVLDDYADADLAAVEALAWG